ncbi:hypothetical protein [Chryseobacterium sp. JV558]|uniref:hypothetical protein n=1 Tax=Chryseobacterium sp. JV558 TaxID=2663236 RepID=UPI00299D1212|nr:hypothetical protein [Chryseobacterium sp. JV558]MDW9381030.1 hypothetical protein [Chryseobacterium sp. JV558]
MRILSLFTIFFSFYLYSQQPKVEIDQSINSKKYSLRVNGKSIAIEKYDSLQVEGSFITGKTGTLWDIYNLSGKIIKSSIKSYYPYSSNTLQIIDAINKMYFINKAGEKTTPKAIIQNPLRSNDELGNNTHTSYKIINDHLIKEVSTYDKIDTTYSLKFDKMSPEKTIFQKLMNNKKGISFERGWYVGDLWGNLDPDFVILKSDKKYGVWSLLNEKYILPLEFDKIQNFTSYLYLEKNGVSTFYPNIGTEPKYKKLEPYAGAFARFETPNGKKGWVDRKGKEYFDQ